MTAKKGPKRGVEQRQIERAEMMSLMRRGYTVSMIAELYKLHPTTVAYDFRIMMKEVKKRQTEDTLYLIAQKREQYAEVMKEAWIAYERCKEEQVNDLSEKVIENLREIIRGKENELRKDKKEVNKDVLLEFVKNQVIYMGDPIFVTEKSGGSAYLRLILQCLESERELLALDPVKETHMTGTMTNLNWDLLSQGIPEGEVPDEIEEELRKAVASLSGEPVQIPHIPNGSKPPKRVKGEVIEDE